VDVRRETAGESLPSHYASAAAEYLLDPREQRRGGSRVSAQ
jgi:hypothetical protein